MSIDWGDGSAPQVLSPAIGVRSYAATHAYLDDDADDSYTISVVVSDDDLGSGRQTAIAVANVNPIVDAGSNGSINEGSTFSSSGSFSDPGADTWTATVNYGDGSGRFRHVQAVKPKTSSPISVCLTSCPIRPISAALPPVGGLPEIGGVPCTGHNSGECIGLGEEEKAEGPIAEPHSEVSSSP